MIRSFSRAGLVSALALLAACQGSSGNARMSVHLVDGPSVEYTQVNLHIVKVEISKDGAGWITLGTMDVTKNLLDLTGGVAETLVDGASIPAGTYGQMRLVLGDGNTVCVQPLVEGTCPADGLHDLKVPSGMQSGVKLVVHFDVQPNTTKDVFIDFDAHRSVFVHEAGNSLQYILRPVVRAFDRIVTGAVMGVLTDAATQAPLPDVEVMAETLDAAGKPAVARSTRTAADGSYVLDLLWVREVSDQSYWIVAQPRVGTDAYGANAAGPIDVTQAIPVVTGIDLAFTKNANPGGLTGSIQPLPDAGELDEVTLLGTVPVASVSHTFVLRSTPATVAGGTETWAIDLLPAATYSLFVTRGTPDGGGGFTFANGPTSSATVTSGTTVSVPPLAAP